MSTNHVDSNKQSSRRPVSFDQPDNARRALLSDANAATAAQRLAASLRGTDGAKSAAEFITAKLDIVFGMLSRLVLSIFLMPALYAVVTRTEDRLQV